MRLTLDFLLFTPLTVVGGVLLAGDHGLGVEERAVGTSADLVNDIRLQVDLALDGKHNTLT